MAEEEKKKEGAIIKKGHEEAMKMILTLSEEFSLPMGLLPVEEVIEVGFVRSTGYGWIHQKKRVEHHFKMTGHRVRYETEITGYIHKRKLKKLKGVKAKALFLWPSIAEVTVDDLPDGNIHFKSPTGLGSTFPAKAFAAGQ